MITLGSKVRDRVTGFEGVATARCEELTSCVSYAVQPPSLQEGKVPERHWFDEPRLEVLADVGYTFPDGLPLPAGG